MSQGRLDNPRNKYNGIVITTVRTDRKGPNKRLYGAN